MACLLKIHLCYVWDMGIVYKYTLVCCQSLVLRSQLYCPPYEENSRQWFYKFLMNTPAQSHAIE